MRSWSSIRRDPAGNSAAPPAAGAEDAPLDRGQVAHVVGPQEREQVERGFVEEAADPVSRHVDLALGLEKIRLTSRAEIKWRCRMPQRAGTWRPVFRGADEVLFRPPRWRRSSPRRGPRSLPTPGAGCDRRRVHCSSSGRWSVLSPPSSARINSQRFQVWSRTDRMNSFRRRGGGISSGRRDQRELNGPGSSANRAALFFKHSRR